MDADSEGHGAESQSWQEDISGLGDGLDFGAALCKLGTKAALDFILISSPFPDLLISTQRKWADFKIGFKAPPKLH